MGHGVSAASLLAAADAAFYAFHAGRRHALQTLLRAGVRAILRRHPHLTAAVLAPRQPVLRRGFPGRRASSPGRCCRLMRKTMLLPGRCSSPGRRRASSSALLGRGRKMRPGRCTACASHRLGTCAGYCSGRELVVALGHALRRHPCLSACVLGAPGVAPHGGRHRHRGVCPLLTWPLHRLLSARSSQQRMRPENLQWCATKEVATHGRRRPNGRR